MSPSQFALRLRLFRRHFKASITSAGRTPAHNAAVGGVAGSPHLHDLGADVVYDTPPDRAAVHAWAARFGLRVFHEGDHDHLQPAGWINRP